MGFCSIDTEGPRGQGDKVTWGILVGAPLRGVLHHPLPTCPLVPSRLKAVSLSHCTYVAVAKFEADFFAGLNRFTGADDFAF